MGHRLATTGCLVLGLFLFGCPSKVLDGYPEPPPDGTVVKCPVSKKTCPKTPETDVAVFEMRNFYFCCEDCRARFALDPESYAYSRKNPG